MKGRLTVGLVIAAGLGILPTVATAAKSKQYVLKHPKERCKPHYAMRHAKVAKREHKKTVKVMEAVCVYTASRSKAESKPVSEAVPTATSTTSAPPEAPTTTATTIPAQTFTTTTTAPTPTTPESKAPESPKPPFATTTTLTIEGDPIYGSGNNCREKGAGTPSDFYVEKSCYDSVEAKVTASNGSAPTSPPVVFDFTNANDPGKVWTYSARNPLYLETWVFYYRNGGEVLTYDDIYAVNAAGEDKEVIGETSGSDEWKIVATYPGSSEYSASESTPE